MRKMRRRNGWQQVNKPRFIVLFLKLFISVGFLFFVEEGRKFRLGLNDLIRTTYNNADYNQLLKVFLEVCDPNVQFIAPQWSFTFRGVYLLVGYFMLGNEVFPDAMMKFIEKRVATFKMPTSPNPSKSSSDSRSDTPAVTTEVIEVIDKFTGTRVLDKPTIGTFKQIVEEGKIQTDRVYTVAELYQIVATKLLDENTIPTALSTTSIGLGQEVTFITETSWTFDLQTNKILIWNYSILATHA
jgi:hypothetical protein